MMLAMPPSCVACPGLPTSSPRAGIIDPFDVWSTAQAGMGTGPLLDKRLKRAGQPFSRVSGVQGGRQRCRDAGHVHGTVWHTGSGHVSVGSE